VGGRAGRSRPARSPSSRSPVAAASIEATGGAASTFTLALQIAITSAFVAVLRRAGRRAQDAAREYHETVSAQEAARLRRDAERTELTLLHNGPLTTLTLVAQGGLTVETVAAVRAQAAVDLAVLGAEAGPPGPGEVIQLADLLDRTVAIIRHRLDVELTTSPALLPAAVAQALAGATAEALENVARHADTSKATVECTARQVRDHDHHRRRGNRLRPGPGATRQVRAARVDHRPAGPGGGRAHGDQPATEGTTIRLVWPS
jgi:hypothetical protein